jgi:hypothetical protein
MRGRVLLLVLAAGCDCGGDAPAPVEYTDEQGNRIRFELGALAFADRVVSFEAGDPPTRVERWGVPSTALGPPDYRSERDDPATAVTLGCGGTLTLELTDNVLVDGEGADLHVFECGPRVEPMHVAVSTDGGQWIDVADVRGQPASVDIGPVAADGAEYRFVRITDLRSTCGGQYSGADIDAVGTIAGRTR